MFKESEYLKNMCVCVVIICELIAPELRLNLARVILCLIPEQ